MSKIAKRAKKLVGEIRNSLVIGSIIDSVDTFLPYFNTIFAYNLNHDEIRAKNVVHFNKIIDPTLFPPINIVFLSKDCLSLFEKVDSLVKHSRPTIYIDYGDFFPREKTEIFSRLGYEITVLEKNFQIWTPKK